MKVAVPTVNKKLAQHFGHCEQFAIVETNNGNIKSTTFLNPPAHQPGLYPKFLSDLGVRAVIAGGMGQRAQDLFIQNNIKVYVGIHSDDPEKLVKMHLNGELESGDNLCDH